jgi:hypothetical protein
VEAQIKEGMFLSLSPVSAHIQISACTLFFLIEVLIPGGICFGDVHGEGDACAHPRVIFVDQRREHQRLLRQIEGPRCQDGTTEKRGKYM